jgi:hypothetical protein
MVHRARAFARRCDLVAVVAMLVLAVGAIQLAAGALSTGVTIDEPIEVDETRSWIEHGWYLPSGYLVDGEPDPANVLSNPYVYGPAFGAVAHGINVIAGNEEIGEIGDTSASYDVRHLLTALLAALAVATVGIATFFLIRSRRLGLWAAAGLLAVPVWTGHGFFNPKDIPAACGYTLVTAALLFALGGSASGSLDTRRRIAIGGMLAAGVFIGAGTRLTLLVPFLLTLLVYAGLRLGQRQLGGIKWDPSTDIVVAVGAAAGFCGIVALYPEAAMSPLTLLVESVSGSKAYPWHGFTLTAGRLASESTPWWYLPAWIAASYPLLLGGLALFGGVMGARLLIGSRGARWHGPLWGRPDLGLLLVLQQALLLPLGAVLTGAVMYDGMRQHLYALPAIAILAGVGADRLLRWAKDRKPARRWRAAATGLLAIALLVPMAEQTLLFPYNYAYVSPIAGIGGVNGRWETDYWFASGPEAGSHTPSATTPECLLEFPSWPCDKDQLALIETRQGQDVKGKWRNDSAGSWLILRRHAGNLPPEDCEQVDDVTRWLRGEQVIMSYVLRCPPP